MALLTNSKRTITTKSTGDELTDELFSELSAANQLICMIAESLGIVPLISEYKGNKFVTRQTIDEVHAGLK